MFNRSTNGKNTLDKFRLTSAQILRRNRFQSVLKRPQSANISTTQNGAGIEFIVENSLQPHSGKHFYIGIAKTAQSFDDFLVKNE